MIKSTISIVFLLISMSAFAAPKSSISEIDKQIGNIQFSKKDEKIGHYMIDLYSQLRKKRLKFSTTNYLSSVNLKNSSFKEFKPVFNRIHKIAKAKSNFTSFHRACSGVITHSKIKMINFLNQQADSYCRKFFIDVLAKYKRRHKISDKDLSYLRRSLPFYLKGESRKTFVKYLESLNSESHLHKLLSRHITSEFIHKEITPHPKIVSVLAINEDLTSYIQSNGLNDYTAKKYFTNEFRVFSRKFNKEIKNEDYVNAKSTLQKQISFYDENKEFVNQDLAWRTFIAAGKKFITQNDVSFTEQVYKFCHRISINKEQKNESNFFLIWRYIAHNDFSNAVKYIEKRGLLQEFSSLPSKVKFWISYSVYKNNEMSLAKYLFKQIVTKKSPLNYYTILTTKILHQLNYESPSKKVSSLTRKPSNIEHVPLNLYSDQIQDTMSRLMVWLELDYDRFSNMEISSITSTNKNELFKNRKDIKKYGSNDIKKNLIFSLIKIFNKEQKHLHSFKLIYSSLNKDLFEINKSTLKYLFPFEYINKIKAIDKTVDPLLLISLIRQESAFNPKARSHVGARGLMQLMPGTAKMFKKRVKAHQLKNPDLNIKIGIQYFKKLLKMFDGNLIHVLAAYNAGENRVIRWKKNLFISKDPLVNIELIPYKETRKYVKLIYRNMFFYNLMSDNPQFSSPLRESFQVSYNSKR